MGPTFLKRSELCHVHDDAHLHRVLRCGFALCSVVALEFVELANFRPQEPLLPTTELHNTPLSPTFNPCHAAIWQTGRKICSSTAIFLVGKLF